MNSISITFLRSAVVGESLYFTYYPNYPSLAESIAGENFEDARVNPGQVEITNNQAVSYKFAFTTDYGSNFITSINGSTVTITSINGSPIFNASTTDFYPGNLSLGTNLVSFIPPAPPSTPPILLEWTNAFDLENNISGYQLSYKTTGSWIPLPFINTSQVSGSYSFTPTQQVSHLFRIRIVDTFGEVSDYKYYNYAISSQNFYQISSLYDQVDAPTTCNITNDPVNTFNLSVYLSSAPPAVSVIVYTDSGLTAPYYGHDEYWIIKSPSGLYYSCLIDIYGVISEVYLCGANTAQISTGKSNANATCLLPLINSVYWNSQDSFAIGTKLYSEATCTTPFIGNKQYFVMEYTDTNSLTLTKVVKIGNFFDSSVIVNIDSKSSVCSTIVMGYRTGTNSDSSGSTLLDGTALCSATPDIACYLLLSEPSIITTGDTVYKNSGGTTIFPGGNKYYQIYIASASYGTTNVICTVSNFGIISIVGFCPADTGGGCCFISGTTVTMSNGEFKNIEDIISGDLILTYDMEKLEYGSGTVTSIESPIKDDIIEFNLSNGTSISSTTEHPFWVIDKGWASYSPDRTMLDHQMNVSKLEVGDKLLDSQGNEIILLEMNSDKQEFQKVYNILMSEGAHTYYANGILVHNKYYIA